MVLPNANNVLDLHITRHNEKNSKKTHPCEFLERARRSQAFSEVCTVVSHCKNTKSLINFMILQLECNRWVKTKRLYQALELLNWKFIATVGRRNCFQRFFCGFSKAKKEFIRMVRAHIFTFLSVCEGKSLELWIPIETTSACLIRILKSCQTHLHAQCLTVLVSIQHLIHY